MDLVVDGKPVKAVAQPTKQNWLYVFDRITGKPVWPIEERPVEKGDVPGEWYSPTQPFVTKPPAYERQGVTIDDLIDYTPELRAEAVKLASLYKIGPIFTPPVVAKWEGPRGTLMLPDVTGGANWQGGSYRPRDEDVLHLHQRDDHDARSRAARAGTLRHPVRPRRAAQSESPAAAGSRRAWLVAGWRWRRVEHPGPAAGEAAVRDDHRDRHEQARHRMEDRAWRNARMRSRTIPRSRA